MGKEFKFHCRNCQQRLEATNELVGMDLKCPACQTVIRVPAMPESEKMPIPPSPHHGDAGDASLSDCESSDIEDLRALSEYVAIFNGLKASAVGSIIFGLVAIGMGVGLAKENPLNAILAVLGVLLLFEGFWLLAMPSAGGLILDGIALLGLGAWNILITIANMAASGGGGTPVFGVIGIFQIVLGVKSFIKFSSVSKISTEAPSKDKIKEFNRFVASIQKSKSTGENDIVEFTAGCPWKGRLMQKHGIFLKGGGQAVIFADRNEIEISEQGKKMFGKSLKASFEICGTQYKGSISPEMLKKFQDWKISDVPDKT